MRPYRFSRPNEEFAAREIIYNFTHDKSFHQNQDEFIQRNSRNFFNNNERTPNSVMDKMKELLQLGLDEFATIKDYIGASIKKARNPLN